MTDNQLLDLLALSHVPRWTIIATSRQQSVAEHSHRVAVIAQYILDDIAPSASNGWHEEILRWAIMHDGPEAITGDIPTPFKRILHESGFETSESQACEWYSEEKRKVSAVKKSVVSLADTIEAVSFISKWGTGAVAKRIAEEMEKRLKMEAEAFEVLYDIDIAIQIRCIVNLLKEQ